MAAVWKVLVPLVNLSMSVEVPTAVDMLVTPPRGLVNCQGPLTVLEQDLRLICKPC